MTNLLTIPAGQTTTHVTWGEDASPVTVEPGATYHRWHIQHGPTTHAKASVTLHPGSTLMWQGLSFAGQAESPTTQLLVTFVGPGATASVTQTQWAGEGGKTTFEGCFHVQRAAQKTNARMLCRNILLANSARTLHTPRLIIEADDVTCSHGATTGGLDDDALFYLMARGLPRPQAQSLLAEATLLATLVGLPESDHTPLLPTLRQTLNTLLPTTLNPLIP